MKKDNLAPKCDAMLTIIFIIIIIIITIFMVEWICWTEQGLK